MTCEHGTVDYAADAPASYHCSKCKSHGCKLWRQYQTCADYIALLCVDCAGEDQAKDVSSADAGGKIHDPDHGPCDQIGWLVPAVPTPDGRTYWGYTSVPEDGVQWWKRLPTRVGLPVKVEGG